MILRSAFPWKLSPSVRKQQTRKETMLSEMEVTVREAGESSI